MRAVIQRVREADVEVDGRSRGAIGLGLLALVCVADGDGPREVETLATKLVGLRIFPDDAGKMNRSVGEAGGSVLLVSQFTLCADLRKGRRPSFVDAAAPQEAEQLVDRLAHAIASRGIPVETGDFGERMLVSLVNEGPVTIVLDVRDGRIL